MSDEEVDFDDEPRDQVREMGLQVGVLIEEARLVYEIETPEQAEGAARFLSERIVPGIARVKAVFADAKAKAHAAHRAIVKAESGLLAPLEEWRGMVSKALGEYREKSEQEARVREEQLVARAILVRERLAAAEGEDIESAPEIPITTVTPDDLPGVKFRNVWRAECDDVVALAGAVAEGRVPPSAILPNMPVLHGMAASEKEKFDVAGCRAVRGRAVVASRKRKG